MAGMGEGAIPVTIEVGAMQKAPKWAVDLDTVYYDLEFSNGSFWSKESLGIKSEEPPKIQLWKEDDEFIWVPRHYELPLKRGYAPRYADFCPHVEGESLEPDFGPRDDIQREAIAALLADEDDKVLCLSCGRGKTAAALIAAATGGRLPMLIIVHTNALMDQWREQVGKFLGIGSVGKIQADVCEYEGKKVAVAMLHTLISRQYTPEFYNYWKLIVSDELHRLGATSFSKACSMFPCERWGLTATPKRSDAMEKVFMPHFSGICYENLEQDLQPKIFFVETGLTYDTKKYVMRNGQLNLPKLVNHVCSNEKRNTVIARYIEKAYDRGRTVLILGERIDQLHELLEITNVDSKALHIGSMGPDERRDALTHRVVFASQQLAKEGLDRPAFDTLLILVPFGGTGRLQQSVGRILRIHGTKKEPYVVVFVDECSVLIALSRKMRRWFMSQGFSITNVKASTL
jgi:superfamily II DNA or RNA helicase